MTAPHTCTTCKTQESNRWRGMREGNIRCDVCYSKERKAIRAKEKRRARVTHYDWGWE